MTIKNHLFLDDERFVEDVTWLQLPERNVFTIARNFRDFVLSVEDLLIQGTLPKWISLDHDLEDYAYTDKLIQKSTELGFDLFNLLYYKLEPEFNKEFAKLEKSKDATVVVDIKADMDLVNQLMVKLADNSSYFSKKQFAKWLNEIVKQPIYLFHDFIHKTELFSAKELEEIVGVFKEYYVIRKQLDYGIKIRKQNQNFIELTGDSCLQYYIDLVFAIQDSENPKFKNTELINTTFTFHTQNPVGQKNMELRYFNFKNFFKRFYA